MNQIDVQERTFSDQMNYLAGNLKRNRKTALALGVIIAIILGLLIHFWPVPNPLPPAIKQQLSFNFAYPSGNAYQVQTSSYKYDASSGIVSYLVTSGQNQIILTEAKLPDSYVEPSDQLAKVRTKIGQAVITSALLEGDSPKPGQSAVIVVKNTLVIVTTTQPLNNQDWINFFNSFRVTR